MADFIELDDPSDPRLADYVQLRDTQLRHRLESEGGLFIAEGTKIIERAVAAGYRPRSFLLAPRWLDQLRPILHSCDAPCYVLAESVIERLTGFHVHRGALASMWRGVDRAASDLYSASRLVCCEDLVDHSNVGSIMRDVAGLGWDGVLLAQRAADPLYRRAIKTSMGTVFAVPWARMGDAGLAELKDAGFVLAALALRGDAIELDRFAASVRAGEVGKVALLLGTEGSGLSDAWLEAADVVVTIPMWRGTDSLNVASAAAVACYAVGVPAGRGRLGETGQSSG